MKKFCKNYCVLPVVLLALVVSGYGCVDRGYDLNNIDGSGDICVGDVITTPPVTAYMTFEGLLGGMSEVERILEENGLSLEDIGLVDMYIAEETFLANLPLDIPLIPEGMLDSFVTDGDDDRVELLLNIESTLPLAFDFRLVFTDAAGNAVTAFDNISIERAPQGETYGAEERRDITDAVSRLSEITNVEAVLLRTDADKVRFLLDNYIELEVRLEKTGGIRLPLN